MNQTQKTTHEDFLVSLTLHNFSADMIREFAVKIVKPYFDGNTNAAIRALMEKAILEENLLSQVTR